MEILFLGTGAATSAPLAFCGCAVCDAARAQGGRNLRRRSSVLIDEQILIDLGPDAVSAAFDYGADFSHVQCLLQTHSHSDHFDAGHLITRHPDYAGYNIRRMDIFTSKACAAHMSEKLSREENGATLLTPEYRTLLNVTLTEMSHGSSARWGEYELIALESAHDLRDGSLMFIIKKGNSAFLYACDTPAWTARTWSLLESLHFKLSAAAIDQCYGPDARGSGHMCAQEVAQHVRRLGCPRVYATHISHEGTPLHSELEAWTRERGYSVAYDGRRILL